MKRFAAVWIALALCLSAGAALAESGWDEGLGPHKPYRGVPAVQLDKTMGYIMLFPTEKVPGERFCDTLEMYLPREDVALGAGAVELLSAEGEEIERFDISQPGCALVRPLTEEELDGLLWGGGTCVELRLPVSLPVGEQWHVHMEDGCLTAADGAVRSPAITADNAWAPILTGEYGVGRVRYTTLGDDGEERLTLEPKPGDTVSFDVALGGEAAVAVVFAENDCLEFPVAEFLESGVGTGTVLSAEMEWGVVFFSAQGEPLLRLRLDRSR